MCGACGERGSGDWARPWLAGPAARAAIATAARAVAGRAGPFAGPRISPTAGGWVVARPTGGSTVCATLGELVAAIRTTSPAPLSPLDPPGPLDPLDPLDPERPSGRLAVPSRDGRTGIVVRVNSGTPPRPLDTALPDGIVTVPDDRAALAVLADLATPPWLQRAYLARLEGVEAPWGRPPATLGRTLTSPAVAADAVLRLEWARQDGLYDGTAIALRCPLDEATYLNVEIRAGHVVRAHHTGPHHVADPRVRTAGDDHQHPGMSYRVL